MLKRTIKYTDFNGVEREEDFYFNLTEAEIVKMEMGTTGGLAEKIEKIVQAKDAPAIMEVFEDLISRSYGVKSADGRRIMKGEEIFNEFKQTEAYSILFMELATDAEKASAFVNAILPLKAQKALANNN